MFGKLLDLVLPPACIFCFRNGSYLCTKCADGVLEVNYDELCLTNINRAIIGYRYNRGIELLWHEAKHKGYYHIASYLGEQLMAAVLARDKDFLRQSVIVPVPLSKAKLYQRGFNQVEKMFVGMKTAARENGQELIYGDYLLRTADTKTQIGQNKKQRRENLAGKFAINTANFPVAPPQRVILLDDISTTGATLSECGIILKNAGIGEIDALVFARG